MDGVGKISRNVLLIPTILRCAITQKSYNIRKHNVINTVKRRLDWRETAIFFISKT